MRNKYADAVALMVVVIFTAAAVGVSAYVSWDKMWWTSKPPQPLPLPAGNEYVLPVTHHFGWREAHQTPDGRARMEEEFKKTGVLSFKLNPADFETYLWDYDDECWRDPHNLKQVPSDHKTLDGTVLGTWKFGVPGKKRRTLGELSADLAASEQRGRPGPHSPE